MSKSYIKYIAGVAEMIEAAMPVKGPSVPVDFILPSGKDNAGEDVVVMTGGFAAEVANLIQQFAELLAEVGPENGAEVVDG